MVHSSASTTTPPFFSLQRHFSSFGGLWRSLRDKMFKLQTTYIPQGSTDIQMEYLNNHRRLSKFLKTYQRTQILWRILAHWYNTYQQQQRTCKNGTTLCSHSPDHSWEMVTSVLSWRCCRIVALYSSDGRCWHPAGPAGFLFYSRQINSIHSRSETVLWHRFCPTGTWY